MKKTQSSKKATQQNLFASRSASASASDKGLGPFVGRLLEPFKTSRATSSRPSSLIPVGSGAHLADVAGRARRSRTSLPYYISLVGLTEIELPIAHPSPAASAARPFVISNDAGVPLRFTEALIMTLPDVVDGDPAKIISRSMKLALEIYEGLKDNIDAVERRIVSVSAQYRVVEDQISDWQPTRPEGRQCLSQFDEALRKEGLKLIELKSEPMAGKQADYEKRKSRIAEIFERVNEARVEFQLAANVRIFKRFDVIEETLERMLSNDLQPSRIANHKYNPEEQERELLRHSLCAEVTQVNKLKDINSWVKQPDNQTVCWLFSTSETRKSTIASPLLNNFPETRESTWIIRTIAYQLALICKPFADALNQPGKYDTIYHGVSAQIQGLLVDPWTASKARRNADLLSPLECLVIIEALDEIEGECGLEFIRALFDVLRKGELQGFKFLATSRPDLNIVTEVVELDRKGPFRLQGVDREQVSRVIEPCLLPELTHFVVREGMREPAKSADNWFITAAAAMRYLAGVEASELLIPLLSGSGSSVPLGAEGESPLLDRLYHQILCAAFRGIPAELRPTLRQVPAAFLCTPTLTSERVIAHLLSTSNDHQSYIDGAAAILTTLRAVLYSENGRALWYHESFPDFLFNQHRSREFWCDEAEQHRILAESCFLVMNAQLKFNIANIPSSFILDCDNATLLAMVEQSIPSGGVLEYACRNWSNHLCLAAPHTLPLMFSEFLQHKALFWMVAMNLLEVRGQVRGLCDRMIRRAGDWIRKVDPNVGRKCTEAANFAVYFSGSPAAQSTPHLYISALATWRGKLNPCREWKRAFPGIPAFGGGVGEGGGAPLMTLNVGGPVNSFALSSDGTRIVSGSDNRSVQVWDVSTGEMLTALNRHTHWVNSVAFSSDGTRIVSGSNDRSVRVWDASRGEMLTALNGHTDSVNSVAFSSDGTHIVSGSRDRSVRVWDASTGEMLTALNGHTDSVNSVAFPSDRTRIVSGSVDNSVRVWDGSTGEGLIELASASACHSDGIQILSGSQYKLLQALESSDIVNGLAGSVKLTAISKDGSQIVTGSGDKIVLVRGISFTPHYLRQRTSCGYTGWLLSPSGEGYLMYVPSVEGLADSEQILSIPSSAAAWVDFTHAELGTEWQHCYQPQPVP